MQSTASRSVTGASRISQLRWLWFGEMHPHGTYLLVSHEVMPQLPTYSETYMWNCPPCWTAWPPQVVTPSSLMSICGGVGSVENRSH